MESRTGLALVAGGLSEGRRSSHRKQEGNEYNEPRKHLGLRVEPGQPMRVLYHGMKNHKLLLIFSLILEVWQFVFIKNDDKYLRK